MRKPIQDGDAIRIVIKDDGHGTHHKEYSIFAIILPVAVRAQYYGNVGIGTASPGAKLDVASSGGSVLQFDTSNPAYISIKIGGVEAARIKP